MPKRSAELDELGMLLFEASTFEDEEDAIQHDWFAKVRKVLSDKATATLQQQRTDLTADMREVVRAALDSPGLIETKWFQRRVHRALCEADGTIGPGEDYVRQFRIKTKSGWGPWETIDETKPFDWPRNAEGQARDAPAGKPFEDWEQPPRM